MRAVVLSRYDDPAAALSVAELATPCPGRGQVLVKMTAAPVNPSDTSFIRGLYGVRKPLPTVPGFEGTGTVVAAGAGLLGRWLVGKRVACTAPDDGPGTWAEYMVASAANCVPLQRHVSDEAGASLFVNPLTVLSLFARARGHRAIVQTAASSALGHMVARHAVSRHLPAIHIVRRAAVAESLRAAGWTNVLDSSASGFEADLAALCTRLGATIAFDAVGGPLTRTLARAMPHGARIIVYGGLGGAPAELGVDDAIFSAKTVEGFWLVHEIRRIGLAGLLPRVLAAQRLVRTDFAARTLRKLPLDQVLGAIRLQEERGADGKVLLLP